jgi:hypothetical protein
MAASVRKKAKREQCAGPPDTICFVEPEVTAVGHDLCIYTKYLELEHGEAVHILELRSATTSSVSGLFKQLRMWRNIFE